MGDPKITEVSKIRQQGVPPHVLLKENPPKTLYDQWTLVTQFKFMTFVTVTMAATALLGTGLALWGIADPHIGCEPVSPNTEPCSVPWVRGLIIGAGASLAAISAITAVLGGLEMHRLRRQGFVLSPTLSSNGGGLALGGEF